jgi:hypothetical protein
LVDYIASLAKGEPRLENKQMLRHKYY